MSVLSSQYPNTVFQWLRAFYIYGDDRYSNSIFAKIVAAVEQGQSKFPFNTGTNRYDFISVEELGRQIVLYSKGIDWDEKKIIKSKVPYRK